MLDQVETQAAGFRKKAKKEKKSCQAYVEAAAEAKKALAIVRATLQETEAARAALATRSEEAEKQVEPVTQELTTLKNQITAMTRAIFGKQSCKNEETGRLPRLSRLN